MIGQSKRGGQVRGLVWAARAGFSARRLAAGAAFLAALSAGSHHGTGAGWLGEGQAQAQSQAQSAKTEARAKLQHGAQLLQQGEFAQALAQFKEAYDLVPSPKIYFNFGIAYVGLGRYSEALESFEHFTQEAKDASPSTLADARQQIENLIGKVERVRVSSDRDGAEVSIDGRTYGLTPLARPIYVDPGAHQLVVQDHDRPLIQNFTAFAGKEGSLEMRFKTTAEKTDHAVVPPPNLKATPPPDQTVVAGAGAETPPPRPIYKRAWFWGTLGVLVAGGVVAALLLNRQSTYPDPSLGSFPGNSGR